MEEDRARGRQVALWVFLRPGLTGLPAELSHPGHHISRALDTMAVLALRPRRHGQVTTVPEPGGD